MDNQDLKTKLVNSIAVTHPELHQQLMNLSAQVPDDIKVSLNENLSKIYVSDEEVAFVLQNLIDNLTAIVDSINHKNNYMLLTNSAQGPKPANLIVSHSEHPIIEEVHHELAQSELITSKMKSVIPKLETELITSKMKSVISKPELLSKPASGIITYNKRKYIYIGLGVLLVIIVILAIKYKKPATS